MFERHVWQILCIFFQFHYYYWSLITYVYANAPIYMSMNAKTRNVLLFKKYITHLKVKSFSWRWGAIFHMHQNGCQIQKDWILSRDWKSNALYKNIININVPFWYFFWDFKEMWLLCKHSFPSRGKLRHQLPLLSLISFILALPKVTERLLNFSTCAEGEWACVTQSCPGTCSIEGGSHISTFDEKYYSFFGDCSYVLTKVKNQSHSLLKQYAKGKRFY